MISRLFLVGMVGFLGISLPDGAGSAMRMTRARTCATPCAARRAAVTFEPIAVDDVAVDRIADELNRRSEGLDIPVMPVAKVATVSPRVPAGPDRAVEKLFADNEVWGAPAAVAESETVVDRLFADNEVWGAPAAVAKSDDVVDRLFADNEVWCKPTVEEIAPSVRPVPETSPAFEPIAVVDGATSPADELNRASEGLTAIQDPEPSIGTALSLTRDAALAWMNVLTKAVPATGPSR